jgi:DNA-binding XRE family transcriptional regulator
MWSRSEREHFVSGRRPKGDILLLSSKTLLRLLEDLGRAGTWTYDLQTGRLAWSDGLFRLLGLTPGSVEPGLDALSSLCDSERRPELEARFLSIVRGTIKQFKAALNLPNGARRWIASQSEIMLGREGLPKHVIGVVFDVTEQELAVDELSFRDILRRDIGESLGIFVLEPNQELSPLDKAGLISFTGMRQADFDAFGWRACIDPADRHRLNDELYALEASLRPGLISFRWQDASGHSHAGLVGLIIPRLSGITGRQLVGVLVLSSTSFQSWAALDDVNGNLIRAGRIMAGWSVAQLAAKSGVSTATISRLEANAGTRTRESSISAITRALSAAGVSYCRAPNGQIALLVDS